MSNRTDLTQFEGHTEGPWQTNDCDSQGVWQEHDESIPRHIAMVHSDQDWEDMTEAEFMRMMADKQLVTAAPDLLDELKRCYEEIDRLTSLFPKEEWCIECGNHLGVIAYEEIQARGFIECDHS